MFRHVNLWEIFHAQTLTPGITLTGPCVKGLPPSLTLFEFLQAQIYWKISDHWKYVLARERGASSLPLAHSFIPRQEVSCFVLWTHTYYTPFHRRPEIKRTDKPWAESLKTMRRTEPFLYTSWVSQVIYYHHRKLTHPCICISLLSTIPVCLFHFIR